MNINKLPKWAQELLETKDRKIKCLKDEVAGLRREIKPTNVMWVDFAGSPPSEHIYYVDKHARVRFLFSDFPEDEVEVLLDQDNIVRIYQRDMLIRPGASNVIYLESRKRK